MYVLPGRGFEPATFALVCRRQCSPAHCALRSTSPPRAPLQRYYGNLRHPDGASNPDLKEELPVLASALNCEEIERKIDAKLKAASNSLLLTGELVARTD